MKFAISTSCLGDISDHTSSYEHFSNSFKMISRYLTYRNCRSGPRSLNGTEYHQARKVVGESQIDTCSKIYHKGPYEYLSTADGVCHATPE